jgi:hypothetical protein
MRPFTADETFLTAQGTFRWHNRSTSSRKSETFEEKQVRTLLNTSNVQSFLQSSLLPKDCYTLDSMQKLNEKELHVQLISIKSKFDTTRKRFSLDDRKLKELELVSTEKAGESKLAQQKGDFLTRKVEDLEKIIENVLSQQDECMDNMQVNFHMLDRSKKNKIFLETKANLLKAQLRRMNLFLFSERRERYKERESKSCTQRIYRMVSKAIPSEVNDKKSVIEGISRDLKTRDFMKSRREDRARRYVEITELAANEAKDRKEIFIREDVMLHKLAARLLAFKLLQMKKKNSSIEEAFLKIRVVTGETSIPELVQKFLTREQTFKELKFTIDVSRKSIEELNKKNSEIEKIINSVSVYDKESRGNEFFRLKEKYANKIREVQVERYRLHSLKVVYEKIRDWSTRISEALAVSELNGDLRCKFLALSKRSVEMLKSQGFRK